MYHILIFVTLYIINIGNALETFIQFGNYSNAEVVCQDHGGLFSNTIFEDNNGKVFLDSIPDVASHLGERDTAWIKGHVEFSKFITWQGCYSEKHSVIKTEMHHTSIYNCMHYCTTNTFPNVTVEYIGLRADYCYCLSRYDFTFNMETNTDINKCSHQKPYFTHYYYNDTSVISVFSIVNTKDWDPNPPSLNQCVYAKSISTTYKYATTSCYGNTDRNIHGFICENGATQGNEHLQTFCVNNHTTSWMDADQQCIGYSGKLIGILPQGIAKQLSKRENYWIGMFRSFKITGESSRIHAVPTACLAVTKIMDTLVLDPDNCSAQKMIICTDGIYGKTSHSLTSRTPTHDFIIPSENSKNENRAGFRTDIIYITVAVSLIAAVTLISCFVARRVKKTSNQEHLLEHCSQSVGYDNETAVDNSEPSSTNVCTDVSVRREIAMNRPTKPSRQSLQRQKMYSPYENFKVKLKTITGTYTPSENVNKEYDRLELKVPVRKKKTAGVKDTDECNIYDHTTHNGESENYDTIKSTKLEHYIDKNTYSTLRNKTLCKGQSQHIQSEDTEETSLSDTHTPIMSIAQCLQCNLRE